MEYLYNSHSYDCILDYNLIYAHPENNSKLFLGNINAFKNKNFISENNIKAIISVLNEPLPVPEDLEHCHILLDDSENQDIFLHFSNVFSIIEKALEEKRSVLVHCVAGISRSATLVISYIMKKFRWCYEKSLIYVKDRRSGIMPNAGFEKQLRKYEKEVSEILYLT
jgi:protein-tyrosine phosphatase